MKEDEFETKLGDHKGVKRSRIWLQARCDDPRSAWHPGVNRGISITAGGRPRREAGRGFLVIRPGRKV